MFTTLTVMLLGTYNSVSNFLDVTCRFTKKVYRSFYNVFVPETYVFFNDIDHPYREGSVNTDASTSAQPLWRYLPETSQFVEWSLNGRLADALMTHQLPILSMELVENDHVIYDLTDFVEKIRVYNATMVPLSPSLSHIIHAWMLASGIILDPSRSFSVRFMTSDAETVTTPIGSDSIEAEDIDSEQVDTEQVDTEQVDSEQVDTEQVDSEQVDTEQVEETTNMNKMD